jgi:DNA-directed RNA polymerase subunit omega
VHLAARRARDINAYYHSLGEGLGQYTPPLVDEGSNKPLSIALGEVGAGKIVAQNPADARRAAEELLGADLGGDEADEGGAEVVSLATGGVDAFDEGAEAEAAEAGGKTTATDDGESASGDDGDLGA